MSQQSQQVKSRLQKNTVRVMLRVLAIFALSAILAAIIGNLIDEYFAIAPWGTLFLLGVFYFLSWIFVLRTMKDIKGNIKEASHSETTDNEVGSKQ